jgi:hypothetical protein
MTFDCLGNNITFFWFSSNRKHVHLKKKKLSQWQDIIALEIMWQQK